MPNPDHEFRNLHAGLTMGIVTTIAGDSIKNDSIAFGAALADLQREGWRLKTLEISGDGLEMKAELQRSWTLVGADRREGPPESMALGESNANPNA